MFTSRFENAEKSIIITRNEKRGKKRSGGERWTANDEQTNNLVHGR